MDSQMQVTNQTNNINLLPLSAMINDAIEFSKKEQERVLQNIVRQKELPSFLSALDEVEHIDSSSIVDTLVLLFGETEASNLKRMLDSIIFIKRGVEQYGKDFLREQLEITNRQLDDLKLKVHSLQLSEQEYLALQARDKTLQSEQERLSILDASIHDESKYVSDLDLLKALFTDLADPEQEYDMLWEIFKKNLELSNQLQSTQVSNSFERVSVTPKAISSFRDEFSLPKIKKSKEEVPLEVDMHFLDVPPIPKKKETISDSPKVDFSQPNVLEKNQQVSQSDGENTPLFSDALEPVEQLIREFHTMIENNRLSDEDKINPYQDEVPLELEPKKYGSPIVEDGPPIISSSSEEDEREAFKRVSSCYGIQDLRQLESDFSKSLKEKQDLMEQGANATLVKEIDDLTYRLSYVRTRIGELMKENSGKSVVGEKFGGDPMVEFSNRSGKR